MMLFALALASALPVVGGEFEDLVGKLGSERFKERQQADERLRVVVKENFATEKERYLDLYFRSSADPEVSSRLEEIIRETAVHYQFDRTNRGFIGITLMAEYFFDAENKKVPAIRVSSVYPDTPGKKAGLRTNDMIVAVDGRRVESWMKNQDFIDYVQAKSPGDPLKLHLPREGKLIEIDLKLGGKPKQVGAVRSSYYYAAPDPKEWVEKWMQAQRVVREKNGFFSKETADRVR